MKKHAAMSPDSTDKPSQEYALLRERYRSHLSANCAMIWGHMEAALQEAGGDLGKAAGLLANRAGDDPALARETDALDELGEVLLSTDGVLPQPSENPRRRRRRRK